MPDNPSRTNYLQEAATFKETVDFSEIGTRWEVMAAEGIRLGAEVEWEALEDEVIEEKNYKGSRRAGDTRDEFIAAAGGASYETSDRRLRIGAEGWYLEGQFEDSQIGTVVQTDRRQVELRTGVEYFVNDMFAFRGGFQRIASDSDLDREGSLQVGNGYSFGVGYIARGGLLQIDATIRLINLDPDYQGYPNSEDAQTAFALGARFLL